MALTKVPTDSISSGGTPDKLIFATTEAGTTVLYTVPSGRKFIGYANTGTSGSYIAGGGTAVSQGTTSGGSYPIYLSAGTSIQGARCNISGIESDA